MKNIKVFMTLCLVCLMSFFVGCDCEVNKSEDYSSNSETFNWYETPKLLAAGEDGTYGKEGRYVYFGVFPQEVVKEEDVDKLGLETSTTIVERGYMDFIKGKDGNYYVKCVENLYVGSGVANTYSDNSTINTFDISKLKYRWFKVMPIKWRVLDEKYKDASGDVKGKLLLAENALTSNIPFYENYEKRTINDVTVDANNYMNSQIRAYLNGLFYISNTEFNTKWMNSGFLHVAFGEKGRKTIKTINVDNSGKQMSKDASTDINERYACPSTKDKIFLLSEYEVVKYSKEAYNDGNQGNSRIRVSTDFAKANYINQNSNEKFGCFWWLRSPAATVNICAQRVMLNGNTYNIIETKTQSNGVVPALCVDF